MKGIFAFVWAGLTALLLAQPVAAQAIQGGVKGGMNFADIPEMTAAFENEGAVDLRYRYGFVIGGFAEIPMTNWIAFQPEALYTQKGMHGRDPFANDFDAHVDYLDVPILFKFQQPSGRGVYGLAGPSLNFNVRAKLVSDGEPDLDVKDEIEPFEIALALGVGVQVSNFLVEGRYAEGLTEIVKNVDSGDNANRNRSFAIMLGLRFR